MRGDIETGELACRQVDREVPSKVNKRQSCCETSGFENNSFTPRQNVTAS